MRLLKWGDDDTLSLTADFGSENETPPYAILSHTWGEDDEEVTFDDIQRNSGHEKPGYKKIRFCGEQGRQDGLQYFWVDTCCINKSNKSELSHAIQSMFRWYRNAARCYVYLIDVSSLSAEPSDSSTPSSEPELRSSKWFTRGWTLQELLAPSEVDFFSQEGNKLGSKTTLAPKLKEITGIPIPALTGSPLSQFSVDERLRWKEYRHTKVPEDGAYSLLGLLDVSMAPLYGEGAEGAFRRLLDKIKQTQDCIRDIRNTDPRDDKTRIQDTKGGLLEDSYQWIFDNPSFRQWRNNSSESRLLWIKGDPGKGKTMLLCGIIDDLQKAKKNLVSYFFCQAADSGISSATAALRGLLYLLVSQQPSLISSVRKKYDHGGKAIFEDANAWVALTEIFADVLKDPILRDTTYLIIDALDECVTDLPKLLDFVALQSRKAPHVKWIVSSRNWPEIEESLGSASHRLSLELNAESVSAAVQTFIERKVSLLSQQKNYDDKLQDAVIQHLKANANDTFLWAALVCQNLKTTLKRHVLKKLHTFPPGLGSLYERMMEYIRHSDDAELCKKILAVVAVVYRPVVLEELMVLVEAPDDIADTDWIQEFEGIINLCGSFLTMRNKTIYFVHKSAQDFVLDQAAGEVFPRGLEDVHSNIFTKSLEVIFNSLHRGMWEFDGWGSSIDEIKSPDPDPLEELRYPCLHWVDHLDEASSEIRQSALSDVGSVNTFFERKYLYWLEALSLCKELAKGVVAMAKLQSIARMTKSSQSLVELVYDAHRFIMYHKTIIEHYPLQVYLSARMFSPRGSRITNIWRHETPGSIFKIMPVMDETWSRCLKTFECQQEPCSIGWSLNSTRLTMGSRDGTVRVWDADSGLCLQTIIIELDTWYKPVFSKDSVRMASKNRRSWIDIWDIKTGRCIRTIENSVESATELIFSQDAETLVTVTFDGTIRVWDSGTGACLRMLSYPRSRLGRPEVTISNDSTWLATWTIVGAIQVWNVRTGECVQTLEGSASATTVAVFSPDSTMIAEGSFNGSIIIWDMPTGTCLQILEGHTDSIASVVFSHDLTRLASGSKNCVIKIWDSCSGACLFTFKEHSSPTQTIAFSQDTTKFASGAGDRTIKIWDISAKNSECSEPESHDRAVDSVAISPNSEWLTSFAEDNTVKIWGLANGACIHTLKIGKYNVRKAWTKQVVFSPDSTRFALISDGIPYICDVESGTCLHTLERANRKTAASVAFSHDSSRLASVGEETAIWDVETGTCLRVIGVGGNFVRRVAFSYDSTRIALGHSTGLVEIRDTSSGDVIRKFTANSLVDYIVFSEDSAWIACTLDCSEVEIWEARSGIHYGRFALDMIPHKYCFKLTGPRDAEEKVYEYMGLAVSCDGAWITYKGKRKIAIPSSYQGRCLALSADGKTAGIGCRSGKVWMITVNPVSPSIDNLSLE